MYADRERRKWDRHNQEELWRYEKRKRERLFEAEERRSEAYFRCIKYLDLVDKKFTAEQQLEFLPDYMVWMVEQRLKRLRKDKYSTSFIDIILDRFTLKEYICLVEWDFMKEVLDGPFVFGIDIGPALVNIID